MPVLLFFKFFVFVYLYRNHYYFDRVPSSSSFIISCLFLNVSMTRNFVQMSFGFLVNWGKRFFRGWKKKRDTERNALFEEHIRRRRFVNKIFCDGIIGGGCKGRQKLGGRMLKDSAVDGDLFYFLRNIAIRF